MSPTATQASRERVETSEDKCGFLNAFSVSPHPPRDVSDSFSDSDLRRISKGNSNGVSRYPCKLPIVTPPNKALLFPGNVNSGGERTGHSQGTFSRRTGRVMGIMGVVGIGTCIPLPPTPGFSGMHALPNSSPRGWDGGTLCWSGISQQAASAPNCWFAKRPSNPNARSQGAL